MDENVRYEKLYEINNVIKPFEHDLEHYNEKELVLNILANPGSFYQLKDKTDFIQMVWLHCVGVDNICSIPNPSKEVQMFAIIKDPHVIKYIDRPHPDIIEKAMIDIIPTISTIKYINRPYFTDRALKILYKFSAEATLHFISEIWDRDIELAIKYGLNNPSPSVREKVKKAKISDEMRLLWEMNIG